MKRVKDDRINLESILFLSIIIMIHDVFLFIATSSLFLYFENAIDETMISHIEKNVIEGTKAFSTIMHSKNLQVIFQKILLLYLVVGVS